MEMDGIYLSTREKKVCLKASQASSSSVQSRIESQCKEWLFYNNKQTLYIDDVIAM